MRMSVGTGSFRLAILLIAILLLSVMTMLAIPATADTPKTTFSGTVYYKNDIAAGATVSVNYAMQTFTTTAGPDGNYNIVVDYVGNGKAVITASYNGDTDTFTWYAEQNASITHDFWITPRPASHSDAPAATFTGHVYNGSTPLSGAHVILVYGKYIIDQYTNDTGYYGLTIYYQGMPGRIWATYGDGRSEDNWPNPGMNGAVVTNLYISSTGAPTEPPFPTVSPTPNPTVTPGASPTAPPKPTPAGTGIFEALLISMIGITAACILYRRKR